MNTYAYGGKMWHAWSEMPCDSREDHTPHTWSSEHTLYGPYMCWGTHGGPKHRKDT